MSHGIFKSQVGWCIRCCMSKCPYLNMITFLNRSNKGAARTFSQPSTITSSTIPPNQRKKRKEQFTSSGLGGLPQHFVVGFQKRNENQQVHLIFYKGNWGNKTIKPYKRPQKLTKPPQTLQNHHKTIINHHKTKINHAAITQFKARQKTTMT